METRWGRSRATAQGTGLEELARGTGMEQLARGTGWNSWHRDRDGTYHCELDKKTKVP